MMAPKPRTEQPVIPSWMTPEIAERMRALLSQLDHEMDSFENGDGDPDPIVTEARAIMALIEPVDPLDDIAREIVSASYPEMKPNYNGRRLTVAKEALRRGMELAKEAQS